MMTTPQRTSAILQIYRGTHAHLVLLVFELEVAEGVHIGAGCQARSVLLHEVAHERLDVLLADVLHHLKHRAVQQVVALAVRQERRQHRLKQVVAHLHAHARMYFRT